MIVQALPNSKLRISIKVEVRSAKLAGIDKANQTTDLLKLIAKTSDSHLCVITCQDQPVKITSSNC